MKICQVNYIVKKGDDDKKPNPIKRQVRFDDKASAITCCFPEHHFIYKHKWVKGNGWKIYTMTTINNLSQSNDTNIGQNRLQDKKCYER